MAKDEQGFFDWLVEDIAKEAEMRNVIRASRDEQGKVDKWKATGIAMGLGHTSDYDMAMLSGLLGAEGAFDDDDTSDSDYGESEEVYQSEILPATSFNTDDESDEFEDTLIGTNYIFAEDMRLLDEAGYDEFELDLMTPEDLKEAMEIAGVDTSFYSFD